MDIYVYIQQLYDYMKRQHQEIAQLQTSMAQLSEEMKKLKEKPSITVEKLEYKFDQLKVETLEGTLNIGLNPSDLNNIDDFSATPRSVSEKSIEENPHLKNSLLEKLNQYVDQQLDSVIHDTERQIRIQLEPQYSELIKEDIRKQLPSRTDHYIHFFNKRENDGMTEEQLFDKMYKTIVADINQGIHAFITQMPRK